MSALPADGIRDLRRAIDAIDAEIVSLLVRRNRLAQGILRLKRRQGMPLYSPEREQQIIARARGLAAAGGLDAAGIARIFEAILRQFVQPGDCSAGRVLGDPGQDSAEGLYKEPE
ncbi:MAG: chorismate mutase [Gammaproteobacteria bacterium]|nr:chorismate mutase [Gammaproteobacteria bacterium]